MDFEEIKLNVLNVLNAQTFFGGEVCSMFICKSFSWELIRSFYLRVIGVECKWSLIIFVVF